MHGFLLYEIAILRGDSILDAASCTLVQDSAPTT